MAYNPKRKIQRLLWVLKRKASKVRTSEDKKRYVENQAKKMDKNPTGCEFAFIELLNELKVKYETQKIIKGKIFDFYIPDKNILVEVDGTYWHGYNKTLNEMNDVQKKVYYNDRRKDTLARGLGYTLIRVWEHELDDESYVDTKERLRKILK